LTVFWNKLEDAKAPTISVISHVISVIDPTRTASYKKIEPSNTTNNLC
jgi:hypothetical protein